MVMQYRLLRGAAPAAARARLLHFAFSPIETPFGRLRMAVDYQARAASLAQSACVGLLLAACVHE